MATKINCSSPSPRNLSSPKKRASVILDRLRSHRHLTSTNEFAVDRLLRGRVLPFVVKARKRARRGE